MSENSNTEIMYRKAKAEDWEDAMALAWRVFKKYEAPVYPKRGVESFLEFITDNGLYRMFTIGEYHMWIALDGDRIVGLASMRMRHHLSLLFVDGEYHRMGIGTSLMHEIFAYIKEVEKQDFCTVNAAPYGVPFYESLGFYKTGDEEVSDGMIIVPMKKHI